MGLPNSISVQAADTAYADAHVTSTSSWTDGALQAHVNYVNRDRQTHADSKYAIPVSTSASPH